MTAEIATPEEKALRIVPPNKFTEEDAAELVATQARFITAALPLAVSQTNAEDWYSMGDHVYLSAGGASKVNRVLRISVEVESINERMLDYKGEKKKLMVFDGIATMPEIRAPDGRIVAPAYSVRCKSTYDPNDDNKFMTNVASLYKKAESQLLRDGIVKIAGLEGYTKDDVEKMLTAIGKKAEVKKVEYNKGAKGGKEEVSAEGKLLKTKIGRALMAIAGNDTKRGAEILEALTTFETTENGKPKTVPGKKSINDLTEKQIPKVWARIKDEYGSYLKDAGLADD